MKKPNHTILPAVDALGVLPEHPIGNMPSISSYYPHSASDDRLILPDPCWAQLSAELKWSSSVQPTIVDQGFTTTALSFAKYLRSISSARERM